MFGDACELLKDFVVQLYCQTLSKSGTSSGLLYLMNALQDLLIDKQNRYIASNKTIEALNEIQGDDLDLLISLFQLLASECDISSASLNKEFSQLLESAQSNRNWIFEAFTVLLVTQAFLFWITVLSRLKKVNQQFKNVLQVFPSRLVLSNFLLKIFLVNTSKGFLDLSIKGDL